MTLKNMYYFIDKLQTRNDLWKSVLDVETGYYSWFCYRNNRWKFITNTPEKTVRVWLQYGKEATEEEMFLEIL